jgi:hypothetical protein
MEKEGKMMRICIHICLLCVLLLPSVTTAHSGRTDSYGGHNKTANGTYHCHSGKCLDDAWKEAYDYFYPIGKEDGLKRNDRSDEIVEDVWSRFDPDQAEYMAPYALKAYKMGYKETYVPTFLEKNRWYIGGLLVLTVFGISTFISIRKKNNVVRHRENADKNHKRTEETSEKKYSSKSK